MDLPVEGPLAKPWDEAWRLQSAIDCLAGRPQQVRVRMSAEEGETLMDFFSPVPSWAQRYLEILGVKIGGQRGTLFSYRLSETECEAALRFLGATLWIARQTEHEEVNG